jgi:hypothetical protein
VCIALTAVATVCIALTFGCRNFLLNFSTPCI